MHPEDFKKQWTKIQNELKQGKEMEAEEIEYKIFDILSNVALKGRVKGNPVILEDEIRQIKSLLNQQREEAEREAFEAGCKQFISDERFINQIWKDYKSKKR